MNGVRQPGFFCKKYGSRKRANSTRTIPDCTNKPKLNPTSLLEMIYNYFWCGINLQFLCRTYEFLNGSRRQTS